MDHRRLPAMLLIAASSSACKQFTPYRTMVPQGPHAEEKYFQVAVDADSMAEGRVPCEDPLSGEQAIQRRFYTSTFRDGNGVADEADEGEYYLSFVEFDDQGWFTQRSQMDALLQLLDGLEAEGTEVLIYVYAHGWKHNASFCDDNVVCFSRLLERTDMLDRKVLNGQSPRTVVGVYLGWRGLPYDAGVLSNLSFWTRKDTAERVGRGGVFELLVRLNDYRNRRQVDPHESSPDTEKTQLVIMGHSFGGLVIYSALSHALMERAAKPGIVLGFGDFVLLVNPAFEGSLYEPLYQIAREEGRTYSRDQRPVMMIVTSEADSATRVAFPIGRSLSTLFQHKRTPAQRRSLRKAIGHDARYITHFLEADERSDVPVDASDCGCPYLGETADWDQSDLMKIFDALIETVLRTVGDGQGPVAAQVTEEILDYGRGVRLRAVSRAAYPSRYPFLVVRTDGNVITDHNAIYNESFINFVQVFLYRHLAMNLPLPGEG